MSKYKYFPDSAEELNSIALGYEFWKTVDEYTRGYDRGTEDYKRIFKEVLDESAEISKIVTRRESELVQSGVIVN